LLKRIDSPGVLADAAELAKRLAAAGFRPAAAEARAALWTKVAARLPSPASSDRQAACFVPGRIEVLGKHTDYAGGRSMVVAVERGFSLAAAPRADRRVSVLDVARGETVRFELDEQLVPEVGHWSNYPMTVGRRIARNFPQARRGADLAFQSDLPAAAGMSSSSALMVAVFLALADVNRLWDLPEFQANVRSRLDLAGYLGTVENGQTFGSLVGDRGVGTFGGSEDHTAMLCAEPGQIGQYAYCPVRFERSIPLPPGHLFAVASSGIAAEKTGAAMEKYNAASRLARRAAELWREHSGRADPHLAAALAGSADAAGRLVEVMRRAGGAEESQVLLARLEHFIAENEQIVPEAGDALARGDLPEFGRLVDQSQLAAEQLLGNQVPETSYLAASARAQGAVAASAFGAGFGGSVWALVRDDRAEPFLAAWSASYRGRYPQHAQAATFFLTAAGPAATAVG